MSDADRDRSGEHAPEVGMPEAVVAPGTAGPGGDGPAPVASPEPGPVVITASQVSGLHASHAEISQSSIESLDAERVDLSHSRARQIEGRLVQLTEAVAVRVEGKRVVAENTRVVGLISDQARFVRSRVVLAITRQTELSSDSRIFVHIGPLRSDVQPAVTTRTAVAFGAGVGLALAAGMGLIGRRSR